MTSPWSGSCKSLASTMSQDSPRRHPALADWDDGMELARHRLDKSREAGRLHRSQVNGKRLKETLLAQRLEEQRKQGEVAKPSDRRETLHTRANLSQLLLLNVEISQAGEQGDEESRSDGAGGAGSRAASAAGDEAKEEKSRRAALLSRIKHRESKAVRIEKLQKATSDKKHRTKLARLLEVRRRDFECMGKEEKEVLRKAFLESSGGDESSRNVALDSEALRVALTAVGLQPRTLEERSAIQSVVSEVGISGPTDFFTFCFEALPRARQALRDLRRDLLYKYFHIYDLDESGHLSSEECHALIDCICGVDVDEAGFRRLAQSFDELVARELDPSTGEVCFKKFEPIFAVLMEQAARAIGEESSRLLDKEGFEAEELGELAHEVVKWHEAYLQTDVDRKGLANHQVTMLLAELGLKPREACDQEDLDSLFRDVAGGSHERVGFPGFLALVHRARVLALHSCHRHVKERFKRMDTEARDALHPDAVAMLLRFAGLVPRCREDHVEMQRLLVEAVQDSQDGSISYNAFVTLAVQAKERLKAQQRRRVRRVAQQQLGISLQSLARYAEVFHSADVGAKGLLVVDEVQCVLDMLQRALDPTELAQAVARFGFTVPVTELDCESAAEPQNAESNVRTGKTAAVIDFEGFVRLLSTIDGQRADS